MNKRTIYKTYQKNKITIFHFFNAFKAYYFVSPLNGSKFGLGFYTFVMGFYLSGDLLSSYLLDYFCFIFF
jgi:hypothetical protein